MLIRVERVILQVISTARWLAITITPELEELSLCLPPVKAKYIFPLSLLSNGSGKSIRHLRLTGCAIGGPGLDCLKNLRSLLLHKVHITGDDLGSLFLVLALWRRKVELSLGEPLQVKFVSLSMDNCISYACANLPSLVPNLEALSLGTSYEVVSKPMVPRPFLHLKYFGISLGCQAFSPAYDCTSLLRFLGAAPSLETFFVRACQQSMRHDSIVDHPSPLRRMAKPCHNNLKSVNVTGFCSAKCLVELTCCIIESAISLDCLTLDTTLGLPRCSDSTNKLGKCFPMRGDMLWVVGKYIEGKVRPGVQLNVLGHCVPCHGESEYL